MSRSSAFMMRYWDLQDDPFPRSSEYLALSKTLQERVKAILPEVNLMQPNTIR